ncbi:MAG: hypothetical protein JKY98_05135 [Gammaproteobacteria bacterium]|nr:hypothetical protein [Gammaproteobacteria bacterium]
MSKDNDPAVSQQSDDTISSGCLRNRLVSSIVKDRRFMILEQLAMVILAISLWMAVS